jgi:hypothetical protein
MLIKFFAFALLLVSASASAESTTSLTTGFDFSSGKYGGETATNIFYIPVTGKYQADNYYLKLTVPYISMSSPGGVVRGMGKIRTTSGTRTTTQAGPGDVTTSAGYTIFTDEQLMLDLVGNIKFGTADASKNLGTGENDYSAQLDGFYTLDKTTLFATAGYKLIGAPAGVTVNNIAYGTLGVSQKTGETSSAGIMLDAAQSSSDISPGTRELTLFVSNKLSRSLKIQANVMKGFSDSSPDFGGGIMLTGTM